MLFALADHSCALGNARPKATEWAVDLEIGEMDARAVTCVLGETHLGLGCVKRLAENEHMKCAKGY